MPNSWIRKLKVDRLRGPKEDRYNLPDTIKQQLEQMLVALAKGDNACMSRSEPIFPTDIQETIKWLQARPDSIFVLFCAILSSQIAIAIGVLTSNRGEGDEPLWRIGRGTRVPLQGAVDVVPLLGAIVQCHLRGRVTTNFGGADGVPLLGAIAGCHCSVLDG